MLENYLRQRHMQTTAAPPPLESSFLESLPEDMRDTFVNQERMAERRRNRLLRNTVSQASEDHNGPEDIDTASFLATLDPALRREVLMDQNAEMLLQLGDDAIASLHGDDEEGMPDDLFWLPSRQSGRTGASRQFPPAPANVDATGTAVSKKPKVDGIELVDRSGIAALLRLLFMPQSLGGTMFYDTLSSLCHNRNTRYEVLSSLMSLLLDGTSDLDHLRSIYLQVSWRAKNGNAKSPSKGLVSASTLDDLPLTTGEHPASLVARQCFQLLSFLSWGHETISSYFLAETHPLSRKDSVKRKAKDSSERPIFPLNGLLELLSRAVVLDNSKTLQEITPLIARVTRPLMLMKRKYIRRQAEKEKHKMELKDDFKEDVKDLLPIWPRINENSISYVAGVITADQCTASAFQNTLAILKHIIVIPSQADQVAKVLIFSATSLGKLLVDELRRLNQSQIEEGSDVSLPLGTFSAYTSNQSKFLRLLKAIEYLFSEYDKSTVTPDEETLLRKIESNYLLMNEFGMLWEELRDCLSIGCAKR